MSRSVTLPLRLSTRYAELDRPQCLHLLPPHSRADSPTPHHRPRWTPQSVQSFSTSRCRRAQSQMKVVKPTMKQPAHPSMARTRKEQEKTALQRGQIPNDIGLLPDTFILPSNPKERYNWTLRKKWLRTRFWEAVAAFSFRWIGPLNPRPRLELGKLPKVAEELHTKMYTSFARGDLTPIQSNLTSGILTSLKARLAQREQNTLLDWRVVRKISRPRLVSYKPTLLPSPDSKDRSNYLLQAVVRLHTRQSLQTVQRTQSRVKGKLVVDEQALQVEPEEKETVEFVVLQKMYRKGKIGEWYIWGFANETTLASIKAAERTAKGKPMAVV